MARKKPDLSPASGSVAAFNATMRTLLGQSPALRTVPGAMPPNPVAHVAGQVILAFETGDNRSHGVMTLPNSAPALEQLRTLTPLARAILHTARTESAQRRRISALSKSNQTLRDLTRTDQLTGLQNQASFHADAEDRLANAAPDENSALILADLDAFKAVNDTHGHAYGDGYLTAFGEALRSATRDSDIAARIGGDEFALFVQGPALHRAVLESLTNRISRRFSHAIDAKDTDPAGRVTFGIALATPGQSYAAVFEAADADLYRAKQSRQTHQAGLARRGVTRTKNHPR